MVRPPAMTTSAVGQLRDCLAVLVRDRCRTNSILWRWPMFFRFAAAAALALSISAPAFAQQATVYDKSQDARADELTKQLAALTARVTTAENNVSAIDGRIEKLTGNVEKLTDSAKDIDARLRKLGEDVNATTNRSNTELTAMKKQLEDTTRRDGDSYVPNISAAMSTRDKFRQDMATAVNRSLRTDGKLLLTNKTSTAQWVFVNRSGYFMRPGEQLPIGVNVGTVTTQLMGEEMQTWTITAPANELALEIVPRPTVPAVPVSLGAVRFVNPPLMETSVLGSTPFVGTTTVAYR